MFNFIIYWRKIVKDNLLDYLRTPLRTNRIKALIKPLKVMYAEFLIAKQEFEYKARFNGQKIYLETSLNDRFDPVNRGIFISESEYGTVYIYGKSESKPATRIYSKWNAITTYAVGKFVFYNGLVYVSNTSNTNKVPGVDPQWTLTTKKNPVIRSVVNYNGAIAFIVNVPVAVVFSTEEMKAHINYYIFAGFGYSIITF
jgi:hypothetical protein